MTKTEPEPFWPLFSTINLIANHYSSGNSIKNSLKKTQTWLRSSYKWLKLAEIVVVQS